MLICLNASDTDRSTTVIKITAKQAEVLQLVADREVSGVCIRYVWQFNAGSRSVTREVRALLNKKLVYLTPYSGGWAAISITDLGREQLS